jgi:hypothetical protein
VNVQTWKARCVLCQKLVAVRANADEAAKVLDHHLAKEHGIEVES